MIGLCYKDMICGKLRWTVLCVVVVCLLPIVVGYLVPETVLPSDNVSVLVLLFLGIGSVCAYGVLLGSVAQTVLDTDKNAEAYMRSLPSSAGRYVYSKYIVLAAIFGLVTVGFVFAFWLLRGIGNDPGVQMLVGELLPCISGGMWLLSDCSCGRTSNMFSIRNGEGQSDPGCIYCIPVLWRHRLSVIR